MFRSPLSYRSSTLLISFSLFLLCGPIRVMHAEANRTPSGIGVDEHVGDTVPLDTPLINESGEQVLLGDYFKDGKPVILIPGYYTCPRLCTLVFNGVFNGADSVIPDGLFPGRDYHIVSLSFDSDDTPTTAHKKGEVYRGRLQPKLAATIGAPDGTVWTFLTGSPDSIADVMDAIGYRYRPDGQEDFTHAAAVAVLSPRGVITRYLYGIEHSQRDFRLALIEASQGKLRPSVGDRIYLFCFRYDNQKGQYSPYAWAFMRIGGGLVLLVLVALVIFLKVTERKG